jgi:hypothetical protein
MQKMLHHVLYQNDNGTSISHTSSTVDRNRVNRGSPRAVRQIGGCTWQNKVNYAGKRLTSRPQEQHTRQIKDNKVAPGPPASTPTIEKRHAFIA